MQATLITTATGEQLIVEPGPSRCWHSEEIAETEITVANGTPCSLCEHPIVAIKGVLPVLDQRIPPEQRRR